MDPKQSTDVNFNKFAKLADWQLQQKTKPVEINGGDSVFFNGGKAVKQKQKTSCPHCGENYTKKRSGPESEFWDTLKGSNVTVYPNIGPYFEGKLNWVSTYAIGLEDHERRKTRLIYKHSFISIELAD